MKNKSKVNTVGKITLLPIKMIQSNSLHPRRYFDDTSIYELAQSIEKIGLIRPLTVFCEDGEEYTVISGERRLQACRLLELKNVPCLIVNTDAKKAAMLSLEENMQNKELNYFEIALFLQKVHDELELGYDEIAKLSCMGYSDINYYLRFLNIDEKMRNMMLLHGVTKKHAMVLLRLPEEKRQMLLDEIIEKKLTVGMTKQRYKEMTEKQHGGRVFGYYKNTDLFVNTVNRAVKTMQDSGIEAKIEQNSTEKGVDYYIHIPKIG